MRHRLLLTATVLGFAGVAGFLSSRAAAAATPSVISVAQARHPETGSLIIHLQGTALTAVKTVALRQELVLIPNAVMVVARTKALLTLSIVDTVLDGDYLLYLGYGTESTVTVAVTVARIQPFPAAIDHNFSIQVMDSDGAALEVETDSPDYPAIDVYGTSVAGLAPTVRITVPGTGGIGVLGWCTSMTGPTCGVTGESASTTGIGVCGVNTASFYSGNASGVYGKSSAAPGVVAESVASFGVVAKVTNGNTGSAALLASHVGPDGDIAVFKSAGSNQARIDKTGKGYFNGGTQTGGADFAECVRTDRKASEFAAGDVVAIDPTGTRRFTLSREASSALVAGVVSTKPGVVAMPREVAGDGALAEDEIVLAVVGIVPVKVCDEGGPVRAGDLLVAASVPGHARKAPAQPAAGTVLGKALGAHGEGRGTVEVLLMAR